MVTIVAVSNCDSARISRRRRKATSSSDPVAKCAITVSSELRAERGSDSAAAHSVNRSRARSRSSCVAARPKVTIMISARGMSCSATNLTARLTMVYVLPVPALASITRVPLGSGPVNANVGGAAAAVIATSEIARGRTTGQRRAAPTARIGLTAPLQTTVPRQGRVGPTTPRTVHRIHRPS